jgi:hypothetical protein
MLFEEKPDLTLCYEVPVTEEQGAEAFANSDLAINEIIYPGTILKHKKIFDQLMKDVGEIGFRAYLGIPKLAPVQKIKIQKNNKISYNSKSLLFCLHSLSLRPPSNEYIQLLISTASKKGWSVYFDHLRDDDIIVCGNASACILPFQLANLTTNQRLFSNSGSASMGYDLPAAIGAAAAGKKTGQRIICFAGDGSLMMNVQELQTLHTSGLNVIVIVINNAGYLSIRQTHENFFGKVVGATPASGVEFPKFSAVSTAFSVPSEAIANISDFKNLSSYLKVDGPLLIDIEVDPSQNFTPRIKSRVDENGKFITPELDDMFPFIDSSILNSVRNSLLEF